jgi:hypothetical protein
MRIGIEINGVLRDTISKLEMVYKKYLMDKTDGIDELETFEYGMNLPVTSLNLRDHFKFRDDDEFFSFLYEEFPMEIFGHAGSTETMTFHDFNEFYVEFRNNHDILIVSDEIGRSKPSSLFFLSKFGCLTEKVKFYSNTTINSMWDEIDVLLTSNPDLLLDYPKTKIMIKFNTSYNQNIKVEHEISSIKELKDKINLIYDTNA